MVTAEDYKEWNVVVRCGLDPATPVAAARGTFQPVFTDLGLGDRGEVTGLTLTGEDEGNAALVFLPEGADCPVIWGVGAMSKTSLFTGGVDRLNGPSRSTVPMARRSASPPTARAGSRSPTCATTTAPTADAPAATPWMRGGRRRKVTVRTCELGLRRDSSPYVVRDGAPGGPMSVRGLDMAWSRRARTASVLLVLFFLLAGLAACGDDDEDDTTASGAGSEASSEESDEPKDPAEETDESEDPEESDPMGAEGDEQEEGHDAMRPITLLAEGLNLETADGAEANEMRFDATTLEAALESLSDQLDADYEQTELDECGEGPLTSIRYPGIAAYFSSGTFAGWMVDDSGAELPMVTGSGVGLGMTVADLQDAHGDAVTFEETSLGNEFMTPDGISGTATSAGDEGTVEVLWAGSICAAR